MTWKNGGFSLNVSVKLFYTNSVCPLNFFLEGCPLNLNLFV